MIRIEDDLAVLTFGDGKNVIGRGQSNTNNIDDTLYFETEVDGKLQQVLLQFTTTESIDMIVKQLKKIRKSLVNINININ